MTNGLELPAEVIGHMAGVSNLDAPIPGCNSCQRALIYGALAYVGAANVAVQEGDLGSLVKGIQLASQALLVFAKVDLEHLAEHELAPMSDEDWETALSAFVAARVERFVDMQTGELKYADHDDEDGVTA